MTKAIKAESKLNKKAVDGMQMVYDSFSKLG